MGDGYEILIGSDWTKQQINNSKLYIKFSCVERDVVEILRVKNISSNSF